MQRGAFFVLGGIVAVACALPDVSIVDSFGDGGAAGAGARAGTGGAGTGGSAGTTSKGGTGGKGAGGAGARGGGAGSGTVGGDSGEAGDGGDVGGGAPTGGSAGDAGNGGNAGSGVIATGGVAGSSSGGASAGTSTGGTSGSGMGGTGGVSPTCGDGMLDAGEVCDDGNTSPCGTCSADCLTATPLAPARGTIQVAAGAVIDGERFTLDDGFGAVDFEFDDDMTWPAGIARVGFSAAGSANALRDAIIAAVNNMNNGLAITAYADSEEGKVLLVNDNDWGAGNRPITDQVSSSAFTHTGMSGGAGRDCFGGIGCTSGDDCDESFLCTADVCT
jgi:cysteine-rich repeat protein